ncbi:F-box protein [Sporobolomyces salmoneus]|uniref:F-box protein n=1 Tax=Sporobolomyces salmoneus TaxID=183962 RepID=UPI003178410E
MPTSLSDLPPELLPDILSPLVRRQDLYTICLVSREWRVIGQQLLYRWIRLFGRDLAIAAKLFETLASTPRLARLVRRLEVRVYPLSNVVKERRAMEELANKMLKNCENIEELVWTRKGALTDVFETIVTLPRLHTFELNASTNLSPGSWDASHLVNLPPLRSLSLILPDRNVAGVLPDFLARQKRNDNLKLEELSILCRESTVINDRIISSIVPHLSNSRLRSLGLAGCSKLTGAPLLNLLPHLPHLANLALEACNLDPSFYTLAAPSLSQLKSLKLTHPGPLHPTLNRFFPSLETLLQHTRQLTAFTLYYSGASTGGIREWPTVSQDFVQSLTESVGKNLRKFELSGVLIDVDAVEVLTNGSRAIKDFVLHLGEQFDLAHLTACFAPLVEMRTLHILSQRADVTPDDVLGLAEQCSSTLRQIGFRNRVWILRRTFVDNHAKAKIRFVETAAAFGAFRRNKYGAEEDLDVDSSLEASSDEEEYTNTPSR